MTEEARRHRKYKLDLGEEGAKLRLTPQAHAMPSGPAAPGKFFGAAKGNGKGPGKITTASANPRFQPYARPAMWTGAKKGNGKGK
mmetsp:Transcript_3639/g.9771  ORF Transcript_3639/g.9771 Transcript_3639/m.9771 type:complete len:85 (+) Transcript_3639:3-257(+)